MYELKIGELFESRYLIQSCLGEGGMGVVFRAIDQQRGGLPCALKVLKENRKADKQYAQRFETELRVMTRLKHPHIVEVFDAAQSVASIENPDAKGASYIVMELLDGESLGDWLKRKEELTINEVIRLISQILSALNYAHRMGIIHRDLKPDNLFLCKGDQGERSMKILDFGIAKDLESEQALTASIDGAMIGTPRYMAPEQMQNLRISPQSDIYAIGVILYQLITGHLLFESDDTTVPPEISSLPPNFQVTWMHMNAPPPPLVVLPSLSPLLESALAKKVEDRPQNARSFRDALKAWLKNHPSEGGRLVPISTPIVAAAQINPHLSPTPSPLHSVSNTRSLNTYVSRNSVSTDQTPHPQKSALRTSRLPTAHLKLKHSKQRQQKKMVRMMFLLTLLVILIFLMMSRRDQVSTLLTRMGLNPLVINTPTDIEDGAQSPLEQWLAQPPTTSPPKITSLYDRGRVIDHWMKHKKVSQAFGYALQIPRGLSPLPADKKQECIERHLAQFTSFNSMKSLKWEVEEEILQCARSYRSASLLHELIKYWETHERWAEINRYQKWYALWSQWSGFEQYGDVTPQIKPVSHWLKSTSRHGEYEAPISAAILIARTIEENAPMHPLKKEEYMLTMLKPLFKDALHLSHIKWSPFLKVLWVESHPILIALGLNTYAAKTSERSLSAFADQLTAVVKKQPLSYILKRLEARAWSFKDPKYALTTLESLPEKAHTLLTAKLLSDLYIDQILYPHLHRSDPESTDSKSTDSESTNPESANPKKTNPKKSNPKKSNPEKSNPEYNEEQITLKAKEHTKMALKRWSDSPRLLLNLTLLQALDHDSRDPYAIKQALSSLNQDSLKSSRDHHRLGQIFIELKKSKSAKRVFKRADTLSPLYSSEIIERAHFYLEMKLYKQAIQSLKRLQTSELKSPSITHYLLGLSYLKSGQPKKAKRNFKAYLKEEPEGEHSENARRWITKKK